jgi:uncharacterized protein YndB with AHSA1/START domain/uncharacterized protein YciI
MTTHPPVRRSRELGVSAERAFEALTEEIGLWWPLGRHSCSEDETASVAFVDGQLVETAPDGTTYVWGEVLRWEPPREVALTWHPGRPDGPATEVELRVVPLGPRRCLVEVVHRGWEALADPVAARSEYDDGWPTVLARLGARLDDEERPETWLVLAAAPGPRWDPALPPREQDGIEQHWAFVDRLAALGVLVGAGPLPGRPGHGQTVVRGLDRAEAERLATTTDQAVTSGLLTVEVVPWLVVAQSARSGRAT